MTTSTRTFRYGVNRFNLITGVTQTQWFTANLPYSGDLAEHTDAELVNAAAVHYVLETQGKADDAQDITIDASHLPHNRYMVSSDTVLPKSEVEVYLDAGRIDFVPRYIEIKPRDFTRSSYLRWIGAIIAQRLMGAMRTVSFA